MSEQTKQPGRAVNPNSKRQQKLAAQAAAIANGTPIKQGRAVNPNSKRQQAIAAKQDAIANGVVVKRGRPATKKAAVEAN